jgi:hypothetical protein
VSGVCRQWTENFDTSFDRGLTARPVVLAKTYEPGASRSRREVAFRARRSIPRRSIPRRFIRCSGDAGGFAAASAARSCSGFDSVASCGFRAIEGFIGCLDYFFRRCIFPL